MSVSVSRCKLTIPECSRTPVEYTSYSQDHEIICYRSGSSLSGKMKEVREISTQTPSEDTCLCFKPTKTQEFTEHSTFYVNTSETPTPTKKSNSKDLFFEILRKKFNIRSKSEGYDKNERRSFDSVLSEKKRQVFTHNDITKTRSLDIKMPTSTWF